jgi:hypothetical protein
MSDDADYRPYCLAQLDFALQGFLNGNRDDCRWLGLRAPDYIHLIAPGCDDPEAYARGLIKQALSPQNRLLTCVMESGWASSPYRAPFRG